MRFYLFVSQYIIEGFLRRALNRIVSHFIYNSTITPQGIEFRDKIIGAQCQDEGFISVEILNTDFIKQTIKKNYNLLIEKQTGT